MTTASWSGITSANWCIFSDTPRFVRVHSAEQVDDARGLFADAIRTAHPRAHSCAIKVRGLLEMRLEQPITEDETAYLTLHIARLTQPARIKENP